MDYIIFKDVTKHFKSNKVIDKLNFSFEKGRCYGITGENGCGKSVLFKLLSGLMLADEGEIIVDGIKVAQNGKLAKNIGVLIESPGFLPDLTGYENLKFLSEINSKINKERILEVLDIVSLKKHKDTKVKKYSLGMLQRLGIAQAIMEYPKFLILDEPFNSLDENGVHIIRKVLLDYIKSNEVTALITSHNSEDILYLSDEILELKDGKLYKKEK